MAAAAAAPLRHMLQPPDVPLPSAAAAADGSSFSSALASGFSPAPSLTGVIGSGLPVAALQMRQAARISPPTTWRTGDRLAGTAGTQRSARLG